MTWKSIRYADVALQEMYKHTVVDLFQDWSTLVRESFHSVVHQECSQIFGRTLKTGQNCNIYVQIYVTWWLIARVNQDQYNLLQLINVIKKVIEKDTGRTWCSGSGEPSRWWWQWWNVLWQWCINYLAGWIRRKGDESRTPRQIHRHREHTTPYYNRTNNYDNERLIIIRLMLHAR